MAALKPFDCSERLNALKKRALDKYGLKEEQLHMGHLMLAGLYGDPEYVYQIDGATDERHTNLEVAAMSTRLANAMQKSGLKTGDHVVIMGPNNVLVTMPFLACHYNGYATCAIDAFTPKRELEILLGNIQPKLVFCSTMSEDTIRKVLKFNKLNSPIVTFQGKYNLDAFMKEYDGNEKEFKPPTFDPKETTAWLILTSGTTGVPKAAVVTYESIYVNIVKWWKQLTIVIDRIFALSSIQWLSSLIYFSSSPLTGWTRIQTSAETTPAHVTNVINKYKPQFTIFAPYLLRQILQEEHACDLSSHYVIGIAGGIVEDDLYYKVMDNCKATVLIMYGMTESVSSPFNYIPGKTPMRSIGTTIPSYSYKLIDDDGNEVSEANTVGELWWKGAHFFKEYLNNPEETAETLTPDGWLKTGDLMSRDENNFYYFHERKKLLFKYKGMQIAPVEIENVIKKHAQVSEAVVVGIPNPDSMGLAVAAIMPKVGDKVNPSEIFALVNKELPVHKRLHGGLFFVDEYPLNAAGKVKRPAVLKQALEAKRILEPKHKEHCCIIL